MKDIKNKIQKGKYELLIGPQVYDSRIGGHSYAAWTEGYVCAIVDKSTGEEVVPRYAVEIGMNGESYLVSIGTVDYPEEKCNIPIDSSWENKGELFEKKWMHIRQFVDSYIPQLYETDRCKEFERHNGDILNQSVTMLSYNNAKIDYEKFLIGECLYPDCKIFKESVETIAKIKQAGFLDEFLNEPEKYLGMISLGQEHFKGDFVGDNGYLIKTQNGETNIKVKYQGRLINEGEYEVEVNKQKEYGRNVAKLAKAINVTWQQAKMFYDPSLKKSDVQQIKSEIQSAREMILKNMYPEMRHELFNCGKGRQEVALRELLECDAVEYQKIYFPRSADGMRTLVSMTAGYALSEYNKDITEAVHGIYAENKSFEMMKRGCDVVFRNLGNSGCLDYDTTNMLKTGNGLQTELKKALLEARKEYCQEIRDAYTTVLFVAENAKYDSEIIKALESFESQNYALDVLRKEDRETVLNGISVIGEELKKKLEQNMDRTQ